MKRLYITFVLGLLFFSVKAQEETKKYDAPHARQAVAATDEFFFVVDNNVIVKRDIVDGKEIKRWEDKRLKHLNSAYIQNDTLFCAHSNYPSIPMHSSIEMWDINTLEHIGSHSFGIDIGSCTWIVQHEQHWYVMFVHYANEGKMQKNRDVSWSQLIKYDLNWNRKEGWVLPKELIEKVSPYSISGGIILEDNSLLCTHHHFKELYKLQFPKMGSTLVWEETIPTEIRGQGIALDPNGNLWGIDKKSREVIKEKLITVSK
ncbi:hypothetical protein [Flammeovirga sp. SubArs3]|uniref:hypothetical protein n=1 Tax=Flammeovirga sp. SubArs3 TaxID=2995316 RepID=UPI00248C8E20|nr:hypothetical protein [Flammeovirga sp. SubArs3]